MNIQGFSVLIEMRVPLKLKFGFNRRQDDFKAKCGVPGNDKILNTTQTNLGVSSDSENQKLPKPAFFILT